MKTTLAALFAVIALTAPVYAVPILQLYMPGSTYDGSTESWLTTNNPFTLQVLGASKNGNILFIDDPTLHIAVPEDWWEDGTTVTLTGPGYESGLTIDSWSFGQPAGLSPHGIYPTHFASVVLPGMDVANGTDVIHDYNPGGDGTDTGVIWEYEVSYTEAFGIHMDATGTALKKNGRWADVFAPYSHDADAPGDEPGGDSPPIPEPSALLLIAGGLVAAGRPASPRRASP